MLRRLVCLFLWSLISINAWAIDAYNANTGILSIPQVALGDTLYSNVKITVDQILAVGTQVTADSYDTYNPNNNQLTIPSVEVGLAKYYNVVITVGKIISVGESCAGLFTCYNNTLPSLSNVYSGQFLFGFGGVHDSLVRSKLLQTNSSVQQIVLKHSNIMNINCFYAGSVHPSLGVWKWDNCDNLLSLAEKNANWKKRAHVAF